MEAPATTRTNGDNGADPQNTYYSVYEGLQQQAERLEAVADEVDRLRSENARMLLALGHARTPGRLLRGKALAPAIEQSLPAELHGQPVHFRDWYAHLSAAGYRVGGSDPLATFLTALTRHPRVEHAGPNRSGLYRLKGETT